MPSARIRLDVDPITGKRTVTIGYESYLDALPHEHEEAHRALLQKLFEGGLVKDGDAIVVEREGEGSIAEDGARGVEPAAPEAVKKGIEAKS